MIEKLKQNKLVLIIFIMAILLIITGVTYSFYKIKLEGQKTHFISSDLISFTYKESENKISITNMTPVSDTDGKKSNYFEFSVSSNLVKDMSVDYEISVLKTSTTNSFNEEDIKAYLTDENDNSLVEPVIISELEDNSKITNAKTIYQNSFTYNNSNEKQTHTYRLRIWLKDNVDMSKYTKVTETENGTNVTLENHIFKFKVNVNTISLLTYSILGKENNNVIETGTTGLFLSTLTNTGKPTYYYKGNVSNNYVKFANNLWRIVRINEDGSIKIVLEKGINDNYYEVFNIDFNSYENSYYSNSILKEKLELWFNNTFTEQEKTKIAKTIFCEAYHISPSASFTIGSASIVSYDSYNPNYYCNSDSNGYGIVDNGNTYVGLLTIDEVILAGGLIEATNNYYLTNGESFWTMSPTGLLNNYGNAWYVNSNGNIYKTDYGNTWYTHNGGTINNYAIALSNTIRPVISLSENVKVTGKGTLSSPYMVIN